MKDHRDSSSHNRRASREVANTPSVFFLIVQGVALGLIFAATMLPQ